MTDKRMKKGSCLFKYKQCACVDKQLIHKLRKDNTYISISIKSARVSNYYW